MVPPPDETPKSLGDGMTGSELLARGTRALKTAGIDGAGNDARRLLAHALGQEAGRLTLVLPEPVDPEAAARFDNLITRRAAREPVSHLTGKRMFYGREFAVTPDVLDPRPETETLIEAALAQPFERLLDLGTGTNQCEGRGEEGGGRVAQRHHARAHAGPRPARAF